MKLNIKFTYPYILSIFLSLVILIYFTYKGVIAYLIHKELYGGGIDVVISLRAMISIIMLFFIILQIQFLKIKDLKSDKTILTGIFIVWTTIFMITFLVSSQSIYFLIIFFINSIITLLSIFSLKHQIVEEKNSLTEKEIYLLQQLAKKK